MHKSQWKKYHKSRERETMPIVFTLFNGGIIRATHHSYMHTMSMLAGDINRGVSITGGEICPAHDGVRACVEIDFRSHTTPTENEKEIIVRICQSVVRECFPYIDNTTMHNTDTIRDLKHQHNATFIAHVLECEPKIKFNRSLGTDIIASGMHIIFPHLVVSTDKLKSMLSVMDTHISKRLPNWSGVVDDLSVHAETVSMRNAFCHKLYECKHPETDVYGITASCRMRPDPDIQLYSSEDEDTEVTITITQKMMAERRRKWKKLQTGAGTLLTCDNRTRRTARASLSGFDDSSMNVDSDKVYSDEDDPDFFKDMIVSEAHSAKRRHAKRIYMDREEHSDDTNSDTDGETLANDII